MKDIFTVQFESELYRDAEIFARYTKKGYDDKSAFSIVMLSAYRRAKNKVRHIDNRVEFLAESSFYKTFKQGKDTYTQIEDILKLMNAKNDLLYISRITQNAFKKLPRFEAVILFLQYIRRKNATDIATVAKISRTAYYDRLKKALRLFYNELELNGNGLDWGREVLFKQLWFYSAFKLLTSTKSNSITKLAH